MASKLKTAPKLATWGLTLRYLFALGLVALLAGANYRLLRAEIRANESSVELLTLSGRQRTLLQSTALLAQGLVSIYDHNERAPMRVELMQAIDSLETAHHRLVEFDPTGKGGPPAEVQEIYESTPWLLDTEIRNYLTHLRELARANADELNFVNPHYRWIREVALKGEVMNGLDAVVKAYQTQSEQRAAQLRRLAQSSLTSTLVVLGLTGIFVFHPMIKRVRQDMVDLNALNETLEERVAERTAIAEQRARELAASEALYHSLVETLPLGVARKDLQSQYTYANSLFCEMVGHSRDALQGKTAEDIFPAAFARESRLDNERVLQTGGVVQRIEENLMGSESRCTFEMLKAPVRDSTGAIIGIQTVLWDITERKAAEERMLHAERLAAIGEMMTGVAHESRNALQQINACAKMLEWEVSADSETHGLITDILRAHDRLHRLFENLRGYVSPLRMEYRIVRLKEVFQEAWNSTSALRLARDVQIRHEGTDQKTRCLVDPFQIEQVFRNVLENSLAACADPVHIHVLWELTQLDEKTAVRVSISDNGPGLSPEVSAHIYDPFFTTRTKGTGLGMAIVHRIVTSHAGTISAGPPDQGEGTQIQITLPRGEV